MQTTGNHNDSARSAEIRQKDKRTRVYMDFEGYPNSRLVTWCAIVPKPDLSESELSKIKNTIRQLKSVLTNPDITEDQYRETMKRFSEFLLNQNQLSVFVGGTTSNDHNKELYLTCIELNKRFREKYGPYQVIAPLKKELKTFKAIYNPKVLFSRQTGPREQKLSYKMMMKKSFGNVRYFSNSDELGLFNWLAKQINLAYNKHLRYLVVEPDKEMHNPKVKAVVLGTLLLFTNPNFATDNIILNDIETTKFKKLFFKKRNKKGGAKAC